MSHIRSNSTHKGITFLKFPFYLQGTEIVSFMRFFRRFIKFSIIYNKTDYCLCKFIIGKKPLYLLAVENVDFTTLFLNLSKIQRFEQFRGFVFVYIYRLINTPLSSSR